MLSVTGLNHLLHGMSCWRYFGEFFKKIFNGCRDFFSLTPINIRYGLCQMLNQTCNF